MDVDDNSQSEEEYEYMYSDDDDGSEGSGDDEMEEGPLENEADAGSGEDDDRDVKPKKSRESRVTKKRKSTGRTSSLGGVHVHEHAMGGNGESNSIVPRYSVPCFVPRNLDTFFFVSNEFQMNLDH